MEKHKDIKQFTAELVPWSLRLINIPLDAPHDEVESFLQKVGFASCVFYWDNTTKEVLGTQNIGWCIVVFPLDGLSVLAAAALNGRVFNGRTILTTQAPSPQWYHEQSQKQKQKQQQQRSPSVSQKSVSAQNEPQQQEPPSKRLLGQDQPALESSNSWDLRKHKFPPAAAPRSISLANIDWRMPRAGVLTLLALEGFSDCKLYWDNEPNSVVADQHNLCNCWVELSSAPLAERACKVLDGFYFKGRCLSATSLVMTSAHALICPSRPTQAQGAQTQSLSDREESAAVSQTLANRFSSPCHLHMEEKPMESDSQPLIMKHELKSPLTPKATIQDILAKPDSPVSSTSSRLVDHAPGKTSTSVAVAANVTQQIPQPQPGVKPNAYEVAQKMLSEPYRKLQETQDAADSKSRFIMEKVMENLKLFSSGEAALPTMETTSSQ